MTDTTPEPDQPDTPEPEQDEQDEQKPPPNTGTAVGALNLSV